MRPAHSMMPEPKDALLNLATAGDLHQMRTLLTASQESPSEEAVQKLLAAAVQSSHLEVVEFLLDQYLSVSMNEEIVRSAVNTGSIPVFKILLARDPSIINMPFEKRGSPLIVACMGRQTSEYLEYLLESGADPNQDPDAASYPLALVAALYSDPDAIDLLLRYGARLEHSGPLAAAARLGNEPLMRRLFDSGARLEDDIYYVGAYTSLATPLHIAVERGHLGVVKILLQHGADPTATDDRGATVFDVARQMQNKGKDVSQMLKILGEDEDQTV
ncbi:hypothetical protein QM012_000063 [Aureobasidium pullulans]|uniref:Ankyrin n=1 Tax=Aureobasidium pullulans TaxID=5580 RepID=A0ABR0TUP1_AURPU